MPVTSQTTRIQPEEPTSRAMSAGTMKMPEPIIEPATIMVASSNPKSRTNPFSACVFASKAGLLSGSG